MHYFFASMKRIGRQAYLCRASLAHQATYFRSILPENDLEGYTKTVTLCEFLP